MSLRKTFGTNKELERTGRWFDLGVAPNPDKTLPGFKMARMSASNPAYQAAVERISQDLQIAIELDRLNEEVAGPIMRQVFVETILLDWRNVWIDDNDTGPTPYDKDVALRLFEELPDLYMTLFNQAKKLSNFRDNDIEEVAGKLQPSSEELSGQSDT